MVRQVFSAHDMRPSLVRAALVVALGCATAAAALAQSTTQPPSKNAQTPAPVATPISADYVIGVDDVLVVVFWKEKDLSGEVVVRPDGKISLPMLNDVPAAGLTPEQLAKVVEKVAIKYVRDPGATVIVKAINSRKVYVVGEVGRPGTFPLANEMTVLQAIAEAGGFLEHADKGDVVVVRKEQGKERRFKFNYNEVVRGKKTQQNIRLLPGDTILVR
jgi:polysaccharide export outer membrane protein